jgi:predicted nucleotidyltransferase
MDRLAVEAALTAYFGDAPSDVVAAYVFGSVARGESRPGSDVDVGVLFVSTPEPSLEALPRLLEGGIERLLGAPAQVVVLNDAPPDLVHRVLRDGRLVLDRDRAARIRFEVRARNEFFDIEPMLKRYRSGGTAA